MGIDLKAFATEYVKNLEQRAKQGWLLGRPVLEQDMQTLWARQQLELLNRDGRLPTVAPLLVQGLQLGHGLRLVALEGEPVSELGPVVRSAFSDGLTLALGYANGEGLYLPVEHMLAEGGYEVESFWEYGWPAAVAEGAEGLVARAVPLLCAQGLA